MNKITYCLDTGMVFFAKGSAAAFHAFEVGTLPAFSFEGAGSIRAFLGARLVRSSSVGSCRALHQFSGSTITGGEGAD